MGQKEEGTDIICCIIPPVLGTASGRMLPAVMHITDIWSVCAVSAITVSLIPLFLSRHHGKYVTVLSAFLCGMFAGISSLPPGISGTLPGIPLSEHCAQAVKSAIDSLPFTDGRVNSLLKALLTADRSSMSPADKAIFRKSGASHLLALSGMHVGILYMIAGKILALAGNSPVSKSIRSIVLVAATGFFCLMTGCGPSIVRAFLFVLFRETASILHRPCSLVRCLADSLLVQMLLSPACISETGFQLSYLAMAGIAFINPRLEGLYPRTGKYDILRRLWSLSSLSISCQIFTAPVVYFKFHTFAGHFMLTNLIATPLITAFMFTGILTAVFSSAGHCPEVILESAEWCCMALLDSLETISTL